jgi:hypothetical protein
MERENPMRQCTLCGRHMKFEGAAELAGTGKASLFDPLPNQSVDLFSCECGRIESIERNTVQHSTTA